ncbi:MAG: hypothetical protein K2X77_21880 [Candidatus Obscuribacterales bacterium]|nr:hypothetical protein [Candidatus Obscuribacterales bacterium]
MAAEQEVLARNTEQITKQSFSDDSPGAGTGGIVQNNAIREAMGGRDVRAPYENKSPNEDPSKRDTSYKKESRYEAFSQSAESSLFRSAYSSQVAQSDSQDTPSERNSALIAGRNENLVAAALPELTIGGQRAPETIILPWNAGDKRHMSYDLMKDVRVKINEGPFHVAERILGKDGDDADKRALTKALKEQFAEETAKDPNTQGIRIGYPLVTERNIYQILMRIEDPACRTRIIERVRQGFTDVEQAKPVPLDARNRPGETRPDRIDDGAAFMKDLAAAAIEVGAHKLWAKGKCAQGARLAFNELPHWNIEGGVVDKVISKDPNGWRSGIILAKDLADSGLFDVIPLKDFGYKNLKEGHVLGRYHYPDYVKDRPSWGGEDYGDIDIVTKVHRPPNDGDTYHSSFVLVPKKKKVGKGH